MSNVEAIKKALEGVTPDRLRYEADAMFAAVQGERHGYTLHARNWGDKPHRVLYDAISMMRDAAATLEALQRDNERLRQSQSYTYIGRDGKSVLARDLEDRAEIAEAEVKRLREALTELVSCHDDFNASSGNMEEAYYKLAKYAYPKWEAARTALASAGEEHHAE